MKDYNLVIQINSPWVVEKLNARSKKNSVLFVDYSEVVKDIFNDFETDEDFDLFRFKLYTAVQDFVRIKTYSWWYRMESWEIYITPNLLAVCLPRKIRRRYFKRDSFYEKRLIKDDKYHYM